MIISQIGKYTDTYLLFKNLEEVQAYLTFNPVPYTRFTACDYNNWRTMDGQTNTTKFTNCSLVIETNQLIDFKKNDIVMNLITKEKYRVDSVEVNDNAKQKKYRLKPQKITILGLIG